MAMATVVFVVKHRAVFDLMLAGNAPAAGEKLFELTANAQLTTLAANGIANLTPVGKIVHCDLGPGVYFVISENAIKYAIDPAAQGGCEVLAKPGKDPWPDPPPPPPEKASYAKMERAVWNAQFQIRVGPGGGGATQWLSVVPVDRLAAEVPVEDVVTAEQAKAGA